MEDLLFLRLVPSSGVATMVIDGSSPSSSVIRHLSFLSRHLGSPQWSSMVLRHRLLSSAIFLSCPVIWGRRNGHRWFFAAIFLSCPVTWGRRNGHRWFFSIVFCHLPSFFLVTSSGVAAMVIDGSSPSSSIICHLSFLSRHLGSLQWSSMVLLHRLLSSAIFLSCHIIWGRRNGHRWFFAIVFRCPPSFFLVPSSGVAAMVIDGIWGRRNGHQWFFAIVFCHPPYFFLVPSSGVAAMVIDGSLPSSSAILLSCLVIWGRRNGHRWFFTIVICHLAFLSRHLRSPQWSSMVLYHRHLPSCFLVSSSGVAAMVIGGSLPSSSAILLSCLVIWGRRNGHRWFFTIVIRHLAFLSRHLGSPQWSSMVLCHRLLSSTIFFSFPVIWGRRNGHRWFFTIVIRHLAFLSRHMGSPQWSSMVLYHRHPPSCFLVLSSGVAAMVIDGSSPSSSAILLSCLVI